MQTNIVFKNHCIQKPFKINYFHHTILVCRPYPHLQLTIDIAQFRPNISLRCWQATKQAMMHVGLPKKHIWGCELEINNPVEMRGVIPVHLVTEHAILLQKPTIQWTKKTSDTWRCFSVASMSPKLMYVVKTAYVHCPVKRLLARIEP